MPEPDHEPEVDVDFSAQLQALIIEAEEQMAGQEKAKDAAKGAVAKDEPAAKTKGEEKRQPDPHKENVDLKELLAKVAELRGGQMENLESLERVKKALEVHAILPTLLNEVKVTVERKNAVNKAMFDALHVELKDYKDAFILEAVLRPVIRDLIALYDDAADIVGDLVAIVAQLEADATSPIFNNLKNAVSRAEHHLHFLLEVLERLQVTQMTTGATKLDKRLQRAVQVELTSDPQEDQTVVRLVKCGFDWREKLFRPEEVVIKKFRNGSAAEPVIQEPSEPAAPQGPT